MLAKISNEGLFLTKKVKQVMIGKASLLHSKDHRKSPLKETLLQAKQIPRND